MNIKALFDFKRQLHKPEYWLQPSQLIKRLQYTNLGRSEMIIPLGRSQKNFYLNENEVIGRSILTMGVYDLVVAETLLRLVKPSELFVDVGANIGYFSRLANEWDMRSASFEPHPKIFQRLKKNLNNFESAQIFPFALSDQAGSFKLYVPRDFNENEGIASLIPIENAESFDVRTRTLDSFNFGKIGLLKIDVEGHEADVLKGAEQALSQNKIENIVFEDFTGAQSETQQILRDYGYSLFGLFKSLGGPLLFEEKDFDRLPPYEAPNFLATKDKEKALLTFNQKGWHFLDWIKRFPQS